MNGGRDYTSTENDLVMEISGAFEDSHWAQGFQPTVAVSTDWVL